MSSPIVFYAWQSDRPRANTRDIVHNAAYAAVNRISASMHVEDSPRLDCDTQNESGTPAIAETIYRKLKNSAIFVGDVTFCSEIRDDKGALKKRIPNPNVMMELGYAAAILGWQRIILVMNKHYGSPESLPFDLKTHSFPVTYDLGPNSAKREELTATLATELEQEVRSCLMKEHDLVDVTLSRLSSHSRILMKQYGPSLPFWETSADNSILSRDDLAIAQMLEAGVIRCVEYANERGVGYNWTYLGKQCCHRIGIFERQIQPFLGVAPQQVIVESSYMDALAKQKPTQESLENEESDKKE